VFSIVLTGTKRKEDTPMSVKELTKITLTDFRYLWLFLDGIVLKKKIGFKAKKRMVLVAYGIRVLTAKM